MNFGRVNRVPGQANQIRETVVRKIFQIDRSLVSNQILLDHRTIGQIVKQSLVFIKIFVEESEGLDDLQSLSFVLDRVIEILD